MSKSTEQLILALKKEIEIYKDYLSLVKNKQEILIEGDIKKLEKVISREQDIEKNMKKIDQIRQTIIGNILFEQKIDWIQNITDLAQYIEQPYQTQLLEEKEKLKNLLVEIKKINEINEKMILQSLDYVEFNLNILTNTTIEGNIYGNSTEDQTLNNTSKLFDAKV
ncbi:flagellar protein FlgN [Anaerophilus nitritogenes]|uniref:flagellar protein FlgN n=1 Tax=Anaerophilus nitritogenes TaxID=2498136 RepID=UPI0013EDA5CA|nr:flagellar protein FlgN [Anaerophilus nitritogenes]